MQSGKRSKNWKKTVKHQGISLPEYRLDNIGGESMKHCDGCQGAKEDHNDFQGCLETSAHSSGHQDPTVDIPGLTTVTNSSGIMSITEDPSSSSEIVKAVSQMEDSLSKSIQEAVAKALAPFQKVVSSEVATSSQQVVELMQRVERLESQLGEQQSNGITEDSNEAGGQQQPKIALLESRVKQLTSAV